METIKNRFKDNNYILYLSLFFVFFIGEIAAMSPHLKAINSAYLVQKMRQKFKQGRIWVKPSDGLVMAIDEFKIKQMPVLREALVKQGGRSKNSKTYPIDASMVTTKDLTLLDEAFSKVADLKQFQKYYEKLKPGYDEKQKNLTLPEDDLRILISAAKKVEATDLWALLGSFMWPKDEVQAQFKYLLDTVYEGMVGYQTLLPFASSPSINAVLAVSWSPSGKKVVVGFEGTSDNLCRYDFDGIKLSNPVFFKDVRLSNYVTAVAWSPDGTLIASACAGEAGELIIWDAVTGKKLESIQVNKRLHVEMIGGISHLSWNKDSSWICANGLADVAEAYKIKTDETGTRQDGGIVFPFISHQATNEFSNGVGMAVSYIDKNNKAKFVSRSGIFPLLLLLREIDLNKIKEPIDKNQSFKYQSFDFSKTDEGVSEQIGPVAFSPDGEKIIVPMLQETTQRVRYFLWDISEANFVSRSGVRADAYKPMVVPCEGDQPIPPKVLMFNQDGSMIAAISDPSSAVNNAIIFNNSGKTIGKIVTEFKINKYNIRCGTFRPNRNQIIVGTGYRSHDASLILKTVVSEKQRADLKKGFGLFNFAQIKLLNRLYLIKEKGGTIKLAKGMLENTLFESLLEFFPADVQAIIKLFFLDEAEGREIEESVAPQQSSLTDKWNSLTIAQKIGAGVAAIAASVGLYSLYNYLKQPTTK